MKPLDALATAKAALEVAFPDVPVLVRGDADPGGEDPVIMLDLVVSTPYGYEEETTTEVQVSIYAPQVALALEMQEASTETMQSAGFSEGQTRPAPNEIGVITDWRM